MYLEEALRSILAQTHDNLVIHLLNDGSDDSSQLIAEKLAKQDERLKIHKNDVNKGIIYSRNKLLSLCETRYAAWMDADDIAHPERLAKQLKFMMLNPEMAACTCHYMRVGMGENKSITISPECISNEYLLFYNYILNPGSFFDARLCKENSVKFRTWISGASDYLFWVEMSRYGKISVVPETLMTYRLHKEQETVAQKRRQLTGCLEIVQYQLAEFGCNTEQEDLARLMIYPAELLSLKFSASHARNNAKTVISILNNIPQNQFDVSVIRCLLFNLFRSQARRSGLVGFYYFVSVFGLNGLIECKGYGLHLLGSSIRSNWHKIVGQ